MNTKNGTRLLYSTGMIGIFCLLNSCWFYSFKGTSIPPSVRTVSIAYIENKALLVNPALSNLLTEKLKEKFRKMTRLEFVNEEGDFCFEGDITGYENTTMGFTAEEVGALNRLTVTVKIVFKNAADKTKNFEKSFSKYRDYPSEKSLDTEEARLVDEIVEELVEDIFNATAADW